VQAREDRAGDGCVPGSCRRQPALDGVVSFDMGRDITDPDSFIALEVFEDREALERQESLAVVQTTLGLLEEALAAEPEATIFHVSSSEPWGA
jgi:quinol monooxygenase YgiN